MYNRYQGNTGRVRRMEENDPPFREAQAPPPPPRPSPPQRRPGLMDSLGRLLPGTREELETEDLLLLLILYLMYRESGDSDLLIVMGAMFLL